MSSEYSPFDYELAADRIAQRPLVPYDSARLLVIDRAAGQLTDKIFTNLPELLGPSDVLVFNNTAVLKARLFGLIEPGGGQVEVLLVSHAVGGSWLCLARPMKKLKAQTRLRFSDTLWAQVEAREGDRVRLRFVDERGENAQQEQILAHGSMPIPPYIRKGRADADDERDYQTIFASNPGSIAAPTASLHFTPQLKAALQSKGCLIEELTLHLGVASFLPLWNGETPFDPKLHSPAAETLKYCGQLAQRLQGYRRQGKRIIAVGTSVVRGLESLALHSSEASRKEGELISTQLFIQPGFNFRLVDALITNFHQPRTTHLLLVEAFLGRDLLRSAYQHALSESYRFLSYGDGMFIA